MNQYSIIAYENGGVELDTFGDIDVSLNYQIDDIFDVSKRNTSFSKTIKLPGTSKNNKFFKGIFDVNIDGVYFNPLKRIPVVVRIGTNDVLRGYLQLMDIKTVNKQVEYEISIAGSLRNIFSEIDDYALAALDLSEYNHNRTKTNIQNSWEYKVQKNGSTVDKGGPGDGYVYPYIINGNSTGIWNNIYSYDMFPAPYVKTVLDKIFEFAGFTYTSEFLNSEYFKKLILPFNGDKLELSDEQVEERTVRVGVTGPKVSITPWRQNGTSWYYNYMNGYGIGLTRESGTVNDSSGELTFTDDLDQWNEFSYFTCQNTGYYDINFVGKAFIGYLRSNGNDIRWNGNSLEYIYAMELVKPGVGVITLASSNGTKLITPSDGLEHPSPWYDTANPLPMNMNATNVAMEPGDYIRIVAGHRHPGIVNWQGIDGQMSSKLFLARQLDGDYTKLTVTPSSNQLMGNELVDMNQILDRKLKMKDFLMDIMKMFNLVLQDNPNKSNDVLIEPRDDFFKSRRRVLNWDEEKKLDNDSEVILTPMSDLDFKNYNYTYTNDGDYFNEEYTDETGRIYGDYEIAVDNDFSDEDNELKIKFAPTPNSSQWIDSRCAPFFADYDDEELNPKKVKPRILFYGGLVDMYQGSVLYVRDYENEPTSTALNLTSYPYCGMWDHPNTPQYDLAFGRTDKIYWDSFNVAPNNNLFQQFHKQTIRNIINPNAKLLECTVHLTPRDIAEFDFRDIVFLLGSYWRVNKIIDYNPVRTDRLTKVELYKIVDIDIIDKYTVEVPTSNKGCPNDLVSKKSPKLGVIIVSASGKEVTDDCCKQYGGTLVDGICTVRPFKPGPIGVEYADAVISKRPYDTGGIDVVPIADTKGPIALSKDLTSRNTLGVKSYGSSNYIPEGALPGAIFGNNSTIVDGVENAYVFGDNISARESGSLYFGNIQITENGVIKQTGINIIDGGEDEVFNVGKTNPIDIIDGGEDSVRNPGGDSKARPIIDGSQNPGV